MPSAQTFRRVLAWSACFIVMVCGVLPSGGPPLVFAAASADSSPSPEEEREAVPSLPGWAGGRAAETRAWLDSRPPGDLSIVVYSLLGLPIRDDAVEQMDAVLTEGIKTGFSSAVALEKNLLCLIKLKKNPADYLKSNLISQLYTDPALAREGIDALSLALLTYRAYGEVIPDTVRNAPNAILDSVISCQQPSGGFAPVGGEEPAVGATARAVTALAFYEDIPYVRSTMDRALSWLAGQQNADGSFSDGGKPNLDATASVLLMAGVCALGEHPVPFTGSQVSLTDALELFACPTGGYSTVPGGTPDVAATELALIARFSMSGSFPFLSPVQYPGYQTPAADSEPAADNPLVTYGKFVLGFGIIFFLIYCLLMLTIKIGKIAEEKKLPGSIAAQKDKNGAGEAGSTPPESSDTTEHTMEMHIPMKAEMPDFDSISERETDIGQSPPDKK